MNDTACPWIQTVSLTPPSLQDNTADADRLIGVLKERLQTDAVYLDLDLLKKLPDRLRKWEYRVCCLLFQDRDCWRVTAITRIGDPHPLAGLAVDLGTTRVALRLVDLTDGRCLAESGFDNPQMAVAPDVLARIHFAENPAGLKQLNDLIIMGLNQAVEKLCHAAGLEACRIYAVSVAGNTAMTHLFMGLDPRWIIREPYIPVVNKPAIFKADLLGLDVAPSARVLIFPNVGSYFGGDLIAGILYAGLHRRADAAILVDVGTNAEVVLGNRDWLIACAGAAGPALEGGVTAMGMMAASGAVDRIRIAPETREFEIHTIENQPPRGICGSGVIDLAAQLFLSGMIDIRGKLVPTVCGQRLKAVDGMAHLVVVPADQSATGSELTISQADIDSLIRSKAAMYTILETITSSVGMAPEALTTFYVAGTFGSFIDPRSAIAIGMLPDLALDSYQPLGNSSLGGAALALTSAGCLEQIDRIRDRITYLELNVNQDFMNRFSAARFLPHTDTARFPSVEKWRSKWTP